MSSRVGIHAVEIYFPKQFIAQTLLEENDNVPGKYTIGLGQFSMGICDQTEDVNSLALTVTHNLIERTGVDLKNVGFLEVGTETIIDKSKSTKSVLMQLFEDAGNFDVAGIDVKSACYGSTAALFNALNWLNSPSCDGRLAIVVAADIAVYGSRNTQPTGGAGAVALLLGPNAPLIVEQEYLACSMRHRYDFYKPVLGSIFPEVDGQLSISCFKEALQSCYSLYRSKIMKKTGKTPFVISQLANLQRLSKYTHNTTDEFPLDYFCFHSPFCRLVAKSLGWLFLEDIISAHKYGLNIISDCSIAGEEEDVSPRSTLITSILEKVQAEVTSRELDTACLDASRSLFEAKVSPGLRISSQVGNVYTASLYSCLVSLGCSVPEKDLRGRRIVMYAYGSGYTASMFSIFVSSSASMADIFGVGGSTCPIERLSRRLPITYAYFREMIENIQSSVDVAPLEPKLFPEHFFPGTYYLKKIDEKYRRLYDRIPL